MESGQVSTEAFGEKMRRILTSFLHKNNPNSDENIFTEESSSGPPAEHITVNNTTHTATHVAPLNDFKAFGHNGNNMPTDEIEAEMETPEGLATNTIRPARKMMAV